MNSTIRIIANGSAKQMIDPKSREEFGGLVAREVPQATIVFAEKGDDVTQLTREAIEQGVTMVVAGGGDGTVNAIASALVDTDIVLGLLPLGTFNHFAKDLGLPSTVEDAVRALSTGRVVAVDVGEVNNHVFLNNSGLGLYPDIVHGREQRQNAGASKWAAAMIEGFKALMRYRLLGIRVIVDGNTLLRRTPAVLIGNNEYRTEGTLLPTRTRLDGGVLSLYVPHPRGRMTLVWFAVRSLFWKPYPDNAFDITVTNTLTIESRQPRLRVSLDGEVTTIESPLTYRSRPRALRVLVPLVT